MRHWWQLGTTNWRAKPVRTALATVSVTLGVAVVVWVTCCYESVSSGVTEMVTEWIGRAHVTVESVAGRWALFDESVADGLDEIPGVVGMTRRILETVAAETNNPDARGPDGSRVGAMYVDLVGVELPGELTFRTYRLSDGRMPHPDEHDALVVEELFAREWRLSVGDQLLLVHGSTTRRATKFRIVGLIDRRRVSSYQFPMLWATLSAVQELSGYAGKIKGIDFILADDSPENLRSTATAISRIVRKRDATLKVSTAEAQLRQLRSAQEQLQFILMLISCVALMTAFFIILSTMSMGVMERITQLGLLRCVGTTRAQIVVLVLLEVIPIGLVGVALGVPAGLGLQWITSQLVSEYVGGLKISQSGITLAVAGGLGTTLLGALGPALRAAAVSPIAATRTATPRHSVAVEFGAALLGLALIACHQWMTAHITSDTPRFALLALAGLLLLYGGYALLAPAVVVVVGGLAVRAAAVVTRIRRELIADQVGRRPWRAGAVCCGLMVGLSLIVGLQVHSESVKAGWQFPKQFPEALIYCWQDVTLEKMQAASRVHGVKAATIADDIRCKLIRRGSGLLSILDPFYRFIAGDPDTFPDLIKLVYLEGEEREALARLRRGGAVLVTREFSQARNIHLGDTVTLQVGDVTETFDVAGVVASPALDIAVSFFQANAEYQVYAVGAFLGTLDDARRLFGREHARLLLFNFEGMPDPRTVRKQEEGRLFDRIDRKPQRDASGEIIPPSSSGHLAEADRAITGGDTPTARAVAANVIKAMGDPICAYVTARQLKQSIDKSIDNMTLLLASIPTVALIVAALGVANLMLANIASRVRQLAVLRAVGMTRFGVVRLVVAEALILGLLGTGLGLLMGVHLGHSSTQVTYALFGFEPRFTVPWLMVAAGAALAMTLCLLAGLAPARAASRSNVVASMQATTWG